MHILIVGGGRWSQVYVDNILSIKKIISPFKITVFSRNNSEELKRKYKHINYISVTDRKLEVIENHYELGIIATNPSSHYFCASSYIHYVQSMIIEIKKYGSTVLSSAISSC